MASLGERIRERRKELGLSQTQLAGYVGLDQSTLSRVEKGDRVFEANRIVALAGSLALDPGELLILREIENATGAAKLAWQGILTTHLAGRQGGEGVVEVNADDLGFTAEEQRWIAECPNLLRHRPWKGKIQLHLLQVARLSGSAGENKGEPVPLEETPYPQAKMFYRKAWTTTQRILLLWYRRTKDEFTAEKRRPLSWEEIARRMGHRHTATACYEEHRRIKHQWRGITEQFEQGKTILQVVREYRRAKGVKNI